MTSTTGRIAAFVAGKSYEGLPDEVTARLAVEAGATDTWWRFVGSQGGVVGIDRFGKSAPAKQLFDEFGFSQESIVESARALLEAD